MKIEHFKFEVEPWTYNGTHDGEEKVLIISVRINGKLYTERKVTPAQPPFETEIEYYTKMALESLQYFLKTLGDEETK